MTEVFLDQELELNPFKVVFKNGKFKDDKEQINFESDLRDCRQKQESRCYE